MHEAEENNDQLEKKMSTHFKNQAFRLFLLEHAKICEKKWSCKYAYCPEVKTLNKHISNVSRELSFVVTCSS